MRLSFKRARAIKHTHSRTLTSTQCKRVGAKEEPWKVGNNASYDTREEMRKTIQLKDHFTQIKIFSFFFFFG